MSPIARGSKSEVHTPRRRFSTRRLALLGGTTTWGDCAVIARRLFTPGSLVRGLHLAEYEDEFAHLIHLRYAISFSSARVGLYGLLLSLGVQRGDEVLVQVPTHIVVANSIRYSGARPVYVDCELNSYNMDFQDAERRVTPRSRFLVLQHTFGIPADIDSALSFACKHNLIVIEDCVHSLGAMYAGRPVGSFGRAAIFSTEETKIISTTMGGMVTTDDSALAARMRDFQATCACPSRWLSAKYLLKLAAYQVLAQPNIHKLSRLVYDGLGRKNPLPVPVTLEERRGRQPPHYEQRLSNGQASLGLRQLKRLAQNIQHRVQTANEYRAWLSPQGFRVPQIPGNMKPVYVRYPVWVKDRAAAEAAVGPRAVVGTWFTSVLEEAESPAAGDYVAGSCPNAEAAANHLINLPTHSRVTPRDVEDICAALAASQSQYS